MDIICRICKERASKDIFLGMCKECSISFGRPVGSRFMTTNTGNPNDYPEDFPGKWELEHVTEKSADVPSVFIWIRAL